MESYVVEKFTALLTDVLENLPDDSQPGRVIAIVPGTQIAWDDCCDGQLTCRLSALVPVSTTGGVQRCGVSYWRATGELALLRCALTVDDQGRAPAPDALTGEGTESLADTDVLLKTLAEQDWVEAISSWSPLGPEGGCRGIQVTFTFKLDQPS